MQVREAVDIAKQYVRELFGDEKITNLGLEEVVSEDAGKFWLVTIGFSRPWDVPSDLGGLLIQRDPTRRSYKVVRISEVDGKVISVQERSLLSAPV